MKRLLIVGLLLTITAPAEAKPWQFATQRQDANTTYRRDYTCNRGGCEVRVTITERIYSPTQKPNYPTIRHRRVVRPNYQPR